MLHLLYRCSILWMILYCYKLFGAPWAFLCLRQFLYVLSSRERTKAPGTRKNQSQQSSAHESQATSFVRLLFGANSFFVQPSGTKELAFHAITATRWTSLKQHLSYSAVWTAVCCDFIGAGFLFRITPAGENCGDKVHCAAACCRGVKLLLIRRSRLVAKPQDWGGFVRPCKWFVPVTLVQHSMGDIVLL